MNHVIEAYDAGSVFDEKQDASAVAFDPDGVEINSVESGTILADRVRRRGVGTMASLRLWLVSGVDGISAYSDIGRLSDTKLEGY